ncbi:MAG: hypothetical protein ACP5SH_21300 [Syntrophobacteraceae bacterium]
MSSEESKTVGKSSSIKIIFKRVFFGCILLFLSFLAFTSFFDAVFNEIPITASIIKGANEYINGTTKRTLEIFTILRGLNSVISTIKDSRTNVNVNAEPGGIGASGGESVAEGEAFQPYEDLIEQASTVMLISSVSLGIQKIFIELGDWLGFKIFLGVSLIFIFMGMFLPRIGTVDFMRFGIDILIFSFIIKVGFPLVLCTVQIVSDKFLTSEYQHAFCMVQDIKAGIAGGSGNSDQKEKNSGIFASIKRAFNNIKGKIETFKDIAFRTVDYIISLIIVITIQSIILPILFLYLLIKVIKGLFQPKPSF